MMVDTLVIINNAAARARRAWPEISRTLKESGLTFEAHTTRHAGDATSVVRSALSEGFETIAVVGGDGTISEAVEGFFDLNGSALPAAVNPEAQLAILPAGTGDDFARGLIGKREPVEEWTARLISSVLKQSNSRTRAVDAVYGRAGAEQEPFVFINVSTMGIGPEVTEGVSRQNGLLKKMPGEARFLTAACSALIGWRERSLRVTIDERETIECASNLVAVANSVFAGGGMMFAPDAKTDDGLLDLLIASELDRIGIVRELPRIRSGGHLLNPNVSTLKCHSVRIEHLESNDALLVEADGNLRGHTPVEFQIMPQAIRVVL
jgi:YegS/Rv2252/BmrU family lipid kinase